MASVRTVTADEFIEAHGEQVITALRAMVEFWEEQRREVLTAPEAQALGDQQVATWRGILAKAEAVVS